MKITIEYESSWRNSFLDGSNNETLPKNGRNFIASSKAQKKQSNYIERSITKDTVMGILNRLVGDQRKLYQARQADNYYFKYLEDILTDNDIVDSSYLSHEVVYLRNISNSDRPGSFVGMVKSNHPLLNSDYSPELFGVLFLDLSQVLDFILTPHFYVPYSVKLEPMIICDKVKSIKGKKKVDGKLREVVSVLQNNFTEVRYLDDKEQVEVLTIYLSALYLQIDRLKQKYDLSNGLTLKGKLIGFSKQNFTEKDFMGELSGGKAKAFGAPYWRPRNKADWRKLNKVNGILEINLNISETQAKDLEQKILNAGVSSFYLGKKGLAYVTKIDTRENL